ncbi:hypothetical protein BHE74_00051310 [Ensete ventricosum]|nr:hypothetical protein BHE74_00051310 [Ensete ventricosum]
MMNSNVRVQQSYWNQPSEFLGDATVVSAFGSLFGAAKRVAAAWCWRHNVQNGASGCSDTEVVGNNCNGKKRKGGNRIDVLRRKSRRWALLAVNRVDEHFRAGDRWCQCVGALARLETGEATGISLEIYSGERKDAKVTGNSISAHWEIGADLVGSVSSGGRCCDSRWTGVDDKICTRLEAVETCCRLTAR